MRILAVLVVAALAACSRASGPMSDAALPTLGGGTAKPAACPAEKCLTAYVAPWCGYCRAATPGLLKLREYLRPKGVDVRFVVGMDKLAAVKAYAETFGAETMLDPDNALGASGGVPHFYVTDRGGRVLRDLAGSPEVDSTEELAAYFGLP